MTASQPTENPSQIVAATDLSELGDRAVLAALRLACAQPKSELHVIAVAYGEGGDRLRLPWENLDQLYSQSGAEQKMKEHIAELIAPEAQRNQDNVERINIYLTVGNPAQRIVDLATSVDADLIVCGTHGRTGVRRLVLGSVAEEVVRTAPCGVLVIRPRDFYRGAKVPEVEAKLSQGAPSLRPFHRAPTHHFVDKAQAASSRLLHTW